jgi:hypothetical protein
MGKVGLGSPHVRHECAQAVVTVPRVAPAARHPSASQWLRWDEFGGSGTSGKGLYAGPGEGDGGSPQHRVNVEAAEIVWRGGVRR